jgi:SAM-dependent methyltransferase
MTDSQPPVCDYEGSTYQTTFWEQGGRDYEDRVEAIALRRLLPKDGARILEVGAGAGRNTMRYKGFEQIVLFDYSRTQLEQAQERLGRNERFVYVVGDVYRLPFGEAVFDAATMIRTLHHIAEPGRALGQIRKSLAVGSSFILEFANKRNLKAILRWVLGRQSWNPFSRETVEFAPLNFNFHPEEVRLLLLEQGFSIRHQLSVSHFRLGFLKKTIPVGLLSSLDAFLQPTGSWLQVTPSVFIEAYLPGSETSGELVFRCPECGGLNLSSVPEGLRCDACGSLWSLRSGIYDFKEPLEPPQ